MKNLFLIAAIGKNNELGKDNKLIWYLPNDLKFFKQITINHSIIMGYNTFKSLNRILPNRKHYILTRKSINIENVTVFNDIKSIIDYIKNNENEMFFIIGGASIYKQFFSYVDAIYLTEIDKEDKTADTYFVDFNKNEWDKNVIKENCDNDIDYKHVLYKRKCL